MMNISQKFAEIVLARYILNIGPRHLVLFTRVLDFVSYNQKIFLFWSCLSLCLIVRKSMVVRRNEKYVSIGNMDELGSFISYTLHTNVVYDGNAVTTYMRRQL